MLMKNPAELTPQTLVNRVMSGKKEYRTNEYLVAFSKLSSIHLHSSSYSRIEIIKLWNSLQTTPSKVRFFTFALTEDNDIVKKKVEELCRYEKYAYICHDKDKSAERKHYHYVLIFEHSRSFSSIANDLEIPVTMLQKVYSKKGILDYLTHENDPNKHHYSLDEIHANFDIEEEKEKNSGIDPWKEFCDYKDMVEGRITFKEWFDKYHSILCDIKSFSQRQQMYHRILEKSVDSGAGMSLSSRAEFHGRTPVKNFSQSAFSKVFPESVEWLDHGATVAFPGDDSAYTQKKRSYRKPNPRADLNDVA